LQRAVRDTMWECCGVVRSGERLSEGLARLEDVKRVAGQVDVRPSSEGYKDLGLALDLRGSLAAAEATIRGAIERKESRGAHQRSDYPQVDLRMQVNFVVKLDDQANQTLSVRPAPQVPDDLQPWLEESEEMSQAKRLLE
jgi:succinate dehydrogenase / fumarate reductase, flavoprotein subunit